MNDLNDLSLGVLRLATKKRASESKSIPKAQVEKALNCTVVDYTIATIVNQLQTLKESDTTAEEAQDLLGSVLINLDQLASELNIDLSSATINKFNKSEKDLLSGVIISKSGKFVKVASKS